MIPIHVTQAPLEMVVVEVTTWCNLKCPGCTRTIGEVNGTWQNKHMALDAFQRVVDNLPASRQIVLHGVGEPTLNPDYLDFIRYARKSGKFEGIVCITNALARDLDYYKAMIAAGMNSFTVSVDSLTQDIADLTRTGTPVEKLRRRLREFSEHGLNFSVSVVASRLNLQDIPLTLQALDALGVYTVHIQPYIEFDDAPNALSLAEIQDLIQVVDALQPQLRVTRVHCPMLRGMGDTTARPTCSSPWREPAVTVDGYPTPCCVKLVADPLGQMDLKQHSFDTLQSSPAFGHFLNDYCDNSPDFCIGCFNNHRGEESRPLVSVTMVTYNHAQYVREALNSVLSQSYSPLEIIISDDASTDNTAEIVEAVLANYSGPHRVRFLRQSTNQGERGRNNFLAAYRQSQGRFIVWFCGDDVMQPKQVECMVDAWQKRDVSLVTVNAEYIDSHSRPLGRYFRDPTAAPRDAVEELASNGANDCNFGAGMGFSRELAEQFDFSETNPPPHLPPDVIFPFYAGLLKGSVMLPEPLLLYRVHDAQTSLSLAQEASADRLEKLKLELLQWQGHLEMASHMRETLDRCVRAAPGGQLEAANYLVPMLDHQHQLMRSRIAATQQRIQVLEAEMAKMPELAEPVVTFPDQPSVEPGTAQASEVAMEHVTQADAQSVIEAYCALALQCLRDNNLEQAAQVCQEALMSYPHESDFWFMLALIMRAAGDPTAALDMVNAAIELLPDNADYLAERADLLAQSGRAVDGFPEKGERPA